MITQIKICRFVIRSIYCSIFALVFLSTANLEAKTFKVTNTNDSGPGSLRQAIIDANNHPGRDRIKFKIPGTAPQTIKTTSILPTITDPVDINGYSQTGARPNSNRTDRGLNAVLKIEIDGSLAGGVDGLSITAGSTTIRGLVMNHYAAAIVLLNKGRNRIHGNYLGTDITGTQAIGNSGFGVIVLNSPNNIIGGAKESESNLISGNGVDGVRIAFSTSTGNKIQGNLIGTDVTGKTGLGNNNDGIFFDNAPDNTVGGESSRARNILSSNGGSGIVFFDDGTFGNKVQGNFIGTDVTGKAGLGNQVSGVFIRGGATNNKIGGTSVRARNVISGNNFTGVTIFGSNTTDNIVEGNFIGVDRSGKADLGNTVYGVLIEYASNNTIGGTKKKAGNIISGNDFSGVGILRSSATGNLVQGNFIGVDRTGNRDLGNSGNGVYLAAAASNNTIGGTTKRARNIISGNDFSGVNIFSSGNIVQGNFIGTNVKGNAIITNNVVGVTIQQGAANNLIGGTAPGAGNVISGNGNGNEGGLTLISSAHMNLVQGNYIGTNANGKADLGNNGPGVYIVSSAHDNTIGGTVEGAANTIAFNTRDGLRVLSGTGNAIQHNSIYSNSGLGIDLNDDSVTLNDAGDTDSGPNNLQNFPVLTSAVIEGGKTRVKGTIDTPNPEDVTLEFFANKKSDPSGHGEGQEFLGTTTPNSLGEFDVKLPKVKSGAFISATATDKAGNTSEFSENIEALKPGHLTKPIVAEETEAIPEAFGLSHNYPNPFNPETQIEFQLPEASQVVIKIFNMLGQEIRTLVDAPYQPGFHRVRWDGQDSAGRNVASGVYLYRIAAGGFTDVKKMSLLR